MSIQAVAWAIEVTTPSPTSKLVLMCLANYANKDGVAYPGQQKLAADTGLSVRSVQRCLEQLVEACLIDRDHRQRSNGSRTSDIYNVKSKTTQSHVGSQSKATACRNQSDTVSGAIEEPLEEPLVKPTPNPQAGLGEEVGGFEKVWKAWPLKHHPKSQDAARAIFKKLSAEHQALAVKHAPDHIIRSAMLHKAPLIINYLKQSLFLELHGAPPLDEGGLFKITPDRPEWREWMGWARNENGEKGVEYFVKLGFIATETRLPATQENAA